MIGDVGDFVRRMRVVLPRGWFGDNAPVTDAVLGAFGGAWQAIYTLVTMVKAIARMTSSFGPFLDSNAADFFGSMLARRPDEIDASFVVRISQELFRPRGTRQALELVLRQLTGQDPQIFEPARAADTGGYCTGGLGYGVAGGWGNLALSHTCFVTAFRPRGQGIASLAGFGTGGVPAYGNLSMVAVSVDDNDILSAASSVLPLGSTAWVRISN